MIPATPSNPSIPYVSTSKKTNPSPHTSAMRRISREVSAPLATTIFRAGSSRAVLMWVGGRSREEILGEKWWTHSEQMVKTWWKWMNNEQWWIKRWNMAVFSWNTWWNMVKHVDENQPGWMFEVKHGKKHHDIWLVKQLECMTISKHSELFFRKTMVTPFMIQEQRGIVTWQ